MPGRDAGRRGDLVAMGLLAASDPDPVGPVAVAGWLVDPAVWA
ncbi:MAG TPA: hypothetical protein VHN80_08425 [Kineosporiaceae bacterium]|nr:hypothetical protein [Kineosporiaceae bacterium]